MAPGESEETGVIARAVLATVTGKRMFGLELPVVTPPAPDERDRQDRCTGAIALHGAANGRLAHAATRLEAEGAR